MIVVNAARRTAGAIKDVQETAHAYVRSLSSRKPSPRAKREFRDARGELSELVSMLTRLGMPWVGFVANVLEQSESVTGKTLRTFDSACFEAISAAQMHAS